MRTLALDGCMWCIVSMTGFRVSRPLLGAHSRLQQSKGKGRVFDGISGTIFSSSPFNQMLGYSLEVPRRGASNDCP